MEFIEKELASLSFDEITSEKIYTILVLIDIVSDVKIFKTPRWENDSFIVTFYFEGVRYGLKCFPDIWLNSAIIFSKIELLSTLNVSGYLAKVITSFVNRKDDYRFVIFVFEDGVVLSESNLQSLSESKKVDIKSKPIKVVDFFAENFHIRIQPTTGCDFLMRKDGTIVLLDWDSLREIDPIISLEKLKHSSRNSVISKVFPHTETIVS